MSGYCEDFSMSRRAKKAYSSGLFPLSRLEKSDLDEIEFPYTLEFAKFLAKKDYWRASEWHHTSKFFNETNFYSVSDLEDLINSEPEKIKNLYIDFKEKLLTDEMQLVRGRYPIWGGSIRKPKLLGYRHFEGILLGNWITIQKVKNSQTKRFRKVKPYKKKSDANLVGYKIILK